MNDKQRTHLSRAQSELDQLIAGIPDDELFDLGKLASDMSSTKCDFPPIKFLLAIASIYIGQILESRGYERAGGVK